MKKQMIVFVIEIIELINPRNKIFATINELVSAKNLGIYGGISLYGSPLSRYIDSSTPCTIGRHR